MIFKKKKTLSLNKLTVQKLTNKQLSNLQGGTGLSGWDGDDTPYLTTGESNWTTLRPISTGVTMNPTEPPPITP